MGLAEPNLDLVGDAGGLLLRDHAFVDETARIQLTCRRMTVDLLHHQRLGVCSLVLLVVPEPPVPDEVDDGVVPEPAAIGERESDSGDRRLGVVGVHVDDRDVEPLREVGRVPRRAALRRVRREPDLVVGDEVKRPAGRVPVEILEVERLRDHALPRERRVAVEQDRERDGRVVCAGACRAIGLRGARAADDNGVHRLEVARIGGDRDTHRARRRRPRSRGAEVVLHVAAPALGVDCDRLQHPLALELAQDLLVRHGDGVREHVEPAAVRHAHHHVVRAALRRVLDRLVEHRDHHVEPLERELLLAEEPLAQETFHPLDLAQTCVEPSLLVVCERAAVAPRLDRLAQPDALLVIGKVLDLVCDRAAVRLLQSWQRLGEGVAGDVDAKDRRRDPRLDVGSQLRLEAQRLERRIADGLRPERVEPRREVPVRPVRLHERHRRGDGTEQVLVRGGRRLW